MTDHQPFVVLLYARKDIPRIVGPFTSQKDAVAYGAKICSYTNGEYDTAKLTAPIPMEAIPHVG